MVAARFAPLCALVLVVGCNGAPAPVGPTTTTTLTTGIKTLDPSPPETTAETTTDTGRGPLTITIGTARLDGRTPDTPWSNDPPVFDLFTDEPTHVDCKTFAWVGEISVPITVVDVAFSNSTVAAGSFRQQGLCERAGADADCRGFTFPPPNSLDHARCGVPVVARKPPGERADTTITLTLRASCSAATSAPCNTSRVVAAGPSPSQPVFLEWHHRETVTTVWHPCTAEEHDFVDGCPKAGTTTSTTPPTSSSR
ncbi:hypothetical protein [Saccharothrix variisporea]|uniref:Thaumatin family protein n=1 Tax=Saccharothrix variisporea TaxID=543527 RepID=A0A495XAF5_9PSEU|nr:hypothetical protein [Saccharothrix variisporea]RKT70967.1 hypothetical protein DFJ66_4244 [Saccharothrix variisporea]